MITYPAMNSEIVRLLRISDDADKRYAALRIEELEREVEEYRRLFDLNERADKSASEIWRRATGKEGTWPDRTNLLVYLMDQIGRLEKQKSEQILLNGRLLKRIGDLKSKVDGFLEQVGMERQTDCLPENKSGGG